MKYTKRRIGMVLFLAIFVLSTTSFVSAMELADEQVLYIGLTAGDIGTMDPIGGRLVQDHPVRHHIYSGLIRHPEGDVTSETFLPDLAESWQVSEDGLTWTFYLREGVQWHWGFGEVTSADVVYSYERVRDSQVSTYRGLYANFKEINALDTYTVEIVTHKPDPYLLHKVANYFGGVIVCKAALEEAGRFHEAIRPNRNEVIGTGPFKFSEYRAKDSIIFERNEDYWRGTPIIEKLGFKYFPDVSAQEAALLSGEIMATLGIYDDVWLNYMENQGMTVIPTGPIDLKALYFNLNAEPFDDIRVRKAFAYAIGQQPVYDMQGALISEYCTSPVPSDMWGHVDAGWEEYIEPNPEKARELLAEAGYPDGFSFSMFMSVGWWYMDKQVIYEDLLREVGIIMDMIVVDHTTYGARVRQGLNPFVNWGSRYPTSVEWLRNFYHSDSILGKPTAHDNWMYYSNPEVDRLIEIAETSLCEEERLEALKKAQILIVEDLPAIPSIETFIPLLVHPKLHLGYELKSNHLWNIEVDLETAILK